MTEKAAYQAAVDLFQGLVDAMPDAPPSPFLDKSYYPPLATVNAESAEFDPSAGVVHVRVWLDRPTPATIIQRFVAKTGPIAVNTGFKDTRVTLTWRPEDGLEQTITVPLLKGAADGAYFQLIQPNEPKVAKRGTVATLTAKTGAVGQQPIGWKGRAPRTFVPTGALQFDLDPNTMKWSDAGAVDTWRTALDGGRRAQLGNKETGLYLDRALFPSIDYEPFSVENGILTMRSRQLATPINFKVGNTSIPFNYGASVLTGEKMPATHLAPRGSAEWVVRTCGTPGSWPALWFIGTSGWPPEIDVYEGFNYDSTFDADSMTSCAIHAGEKGVQAFGLGTRISATEGGFAPGMLTRDVSFAVHRDGTYLTFFVDGKETYQMIDGFPFDSFWPLMNLAVRMTAPYAGGDFQVKHFRTWRG